MAWSLALRKRNSQPFIQFLADAIPALALYAATFIFAILRGAKPLDIFQLGQSLGWWELHQDPTTALTDLHIQPPGWNLLTLLLSPDEDPEMWLLVGANAAVAVGIIAVMVQVMRMCAISRPITILVSCLWVLLPATYLYTFWPYNTLVVALASLSVVLGLAIARRYSSLGILTAGSSLWILALLRPSWHPFVVVIGIIVLGTVALKWRVSRLRLVGVVLVVLGSTLLLMQYHYVSSFGIWASSSWGGANAVKALSLSGHFYRTGLPAVEGVDAACVAQLVKGSGFVAERDFYLPCLPYLTKDAQRSFREHGPKVHSGYEQYNSQWRLEIYDLATKVASRSLLQHPRELPMSILALAKTSIPQYLGDPGAYAFIDANPPEVAPWHRLGALYEPFLSLVAWILVLAYGVVRLLQCGVRDAFRRIAQKPWLFGALVILGYHSGVAVFAEVGENSRFHFEILPIVLVLMGYAVEGFRRNGLHLRNDRISTLSVPRFQD